MMRFIATVLLSAALTLTANSQEWSLEFFAGATGYNGDLTKSSLELRSLRPAVGANIRYQFHPMFSFRGGLMYGAVAGSDKHTGDSLLMDRNLSFQTSILEANFVVEAAVLDPEIFSSYPYIFAGVGLFHFNPFARDANNEKIYLHPLRTEGQGLPDFPERKEYKLTQLCIPFGIGARFRVSDQFSIGAEIGFRKLFTDYLDDVSNTYVDPIKLSQASGPKAIEISYRGDEVGSHYNPYPPHGTIRGNPKKDDWYYFGGIKLTWHFGEGFSY